jgi:hypothetical protein
MTMNASALLVRIKIVDALQKHMGVANLHGGSLALRFGGRS